MQEYVLLDASPLGLAVIVATMNVGHLARYCDARLWTSIT
jgi:hypothetical protein